MIALAWCWHCDPPCHIRARTLKTVGCRAKIALAQWEQRVARCPMACPGDGPIVRSRVPPVWSPV